jgi:hypothetical protein
MHDFHANRHPGGRLPRPGARREHAEEADGLHRPRRFAHAFESYINKTASPYTEMLALESIGISEWGSRDARKSEDIAARGDMLWASALAGMAISHTGTTLPTASARPERPYERSPRGRRRRVPPGGHPVDPASGAGKVRRDRRRPR